MTETNSQRQRLHHKMPPNTACTRLLHERRGVRKPLGVSLLDKNCIQQKGVSDMIRSLLVGVLMVFVLSACSTPVTSVPAPTNTPVSLPTEAPVSEQPSSLGYSSVEEALADLKTRDNVSIEVSQGWTIVTEADGLTTWSFTPSNHPAHPAVAKRVLYEDQEGWHIKMDVLCEAEKAACDQFVKDFEALNQQMRQAIEQQKSP